MFCLSIAQRSSIRDDVVRFQDRSIDETAASARRDEAHGGGNKADARGGGGGGDGGGVVGGANVKGRSLGLIAGETKMLFEVRKRKPIYQDSGID